MRIEEIPDVSPGKTYKVRGSTLAAIKESLKSLWRGDNIAVGGTISKKGFGGGVTIFGEPSRGGGGSSSGDHPFKFSVREKEGSPGEFEGMVTLESSLYKSLRPNDKQSITGLDSWFDVIPNDAIWLGIVFDSGGEIVSASIDSWGQSDSFSVSASAWSGSNGYCEDDGGDPPSHQASRKLIAYTLADIGGFPVVHQVMFRDQVLRDCNIDGRPARYPFDHEGGYPL
jgi:hypothetical protein